MYECIYIYICIHTHVYICVYSFWISSYVAPGAGASHNDYLLTVVISYIIVILHKSGNCYFT